MGKRKDRTAITKRREKARLRQKQKKDAKKQGNTRPNGGTNRTSLPPPMFINRPAITDIEVPRGFRAIGMAQGMSEYGKPLLELAEEKGVDDINAALRIGMATWNFALIEGSEGPAARNDIIDEMRTLFRLGAQAAADLFENMIARKTYLFPEDIQPKNPMVMFIRNETPHLVAAFNYDALNLSQDPVPPNQEDQALVRGLERLDRSIEEEEDYSDYESHFFATRDACAERFEQWLLQKGLEIHRGDFAYCLHPFMDFVYAYMHDDIVTLKSLSAHDLVEFFSDYLIRKVMVDPHEYVEWPPALKLFYEFLGEKKYIDDPEPVIDMVTAIEPEFVATLRRRYASA